MKPMSNRFPLVLKATALVTAVSTAALVALYNFRPQSWMLTTAISLGTTCYHFSMRLLAGWIVPALFRNIDPYRRWFQPHKFETAFYEKLHVKQWKGKLPTYAPEQFDLRINSLRQVIRNTCTAELVHEMIVLLSFIPLLFSHYFGAFSVFLFTSFASGLFDCIFVIAQRYNRPRLVRILEKKEASGRE